MEIDDGLLAFGAEEEYYTASPIPFSILGAANPQDYGDYFAWGETASKTDYKDDWSNYFDTLDGGSTFTKYNISGGKTVLDLENDAARANWGGSWRMPTNAEMEALLGLSKEWGTYEGANGYKFTGNGKTLFLPAAGSLLGANLCNAGSFGYYWSSSLYEYNSGYAWDVYFGSEYADSDDYGYRYLGQSVRPVTE